MSFSFAKISINKNRSTPKVKCLISSLRPTSVGQLMLKKAFGSDADQAAIFDRVHIQFEIFLIRIYLLCMCNTNINHCSISPLILIIVCIHCSGICNIWPSRNGSLHLHNRFYVSLLDTSPRVRPVDQRINQVPR